MMKAKRAMPRKTTGTKTVRKAASQAKHSTPRIVRKPTPTPTPKPTMLRAPELIESVQALPEPIQASSTLHEPSNIAPNRYCQRMSIGLSTYQAQKFLLAQRLADKIDSLVGSILPEESARYDLCIMVEIVEARPI